MKTPVGALLGSLLVATPAWSAPICNTLFGTQTTVSSEQLSFCESTAQGLVDRLSIMALKAAASWATSGRCPASMSRSMALGLGEGVFLRQSRALQRRPDQQKTMRRVKLPALVLAGAADTLVPLRRSEFTAGLMPFGKLVVIPDAGHLAPLEQPEAVSEALAAFLSGPVLLR